jgi:hypothetical protein
LYGKEGGGVSGEKYEEIFNFAGFDLRRKEKEGKIKTGFKITGGMTYGII